MTAKGTKQKLAMHQSSGSFLGTPPIPNAMVFRQLSCREQTYELEYSAGRYSFSDQAPCPFLLTHQCSLIDSAETATLLLLHTLPM